MPEAHDNNFAEIPFESQNDTHTYAPDDSGEDIAAASDMLSDERAESGDADDAIEPIEDIGDQPDALFPGLPDVGPVLTFRQFYQVHGVTYEGQHPDAGVQQELDNMKAGTIDAYDALHRLIDTTLNVNGKYEREIAIARAALATDFGDSAGDISMTFLPPDAFRLAQKISKAGFGSSGFSAFGHAVIAADPADVRDMGRETLIHTAIHEGVHTNRARGPYTLLCLPDVPQAIFGTVPPALVMEESPWLFPDPDEMPDLAAIDSFLEEGSVESYVIRQRIGRDPDWLHRHDNESVIVPVTADIALQVTNDPTAPLVDSKTGMLAVPWKYIKATRNVYRPSFRNPLARDTLIRRSPSSLAAYGIDLLDRHRLPGLADQMVHVRNDIPLRKVVRDRINSVDPDREVPLYTDLVRLHYTSPSFIRGTRMIIEALGIENEHVDAS